MKIGIIGAGPAGLSAGRHCLEQGHQIDIFEQTGRIGGTWVYTDDIGLDQHGLAIHSSMYTGLRTNLPKELMEYEQYKYTDQDTERQELSSYIGQEEVLKYIESFAKHFGLISHIKFYQHVIKVDSFKDNKWTVNVENLTNKNINVYCFDAIFICNGHYSEPFTPEVMGLDGFSGRYRHSHAYRNAADYKDKRVIIVGAGPSGLDIARHIIPICKQLYISHKMSDDIKVPLDIPQKPQIREIKDDLITFVDGNQEQFDEILFCTGYKYKFPFLTTQCKITIKDNWVHSLYKHVINIEKPTMAFIGIPFTICPFPMFDIQVRFFLATLSGQFQLPSRTAMLDDLHRDLRLRKEMGWPLRHAHKIGDRQGEYFDDLATTANIAAVPSVINKMYLDVRRNRNFNDYYKVIDADQFIKSTINI